MPPNRSGYLISLFAALSWSLTGPGVKLIQDRFSLEPLSLAFWRILFMTTALVIGLLIFRPSLLKINSEQLRGLLLSGIVGIGIYQTLFVYSIKQNGAAVGIVLVYIFPTLVTFGSWLLFKERVSTVQWVALAISLMGCALLVRAYDPAMLQLNPWGAALGLLSAIAQATYTLLNRRLSQSANTHWVTTLTYTFVFGCLTLLAFVLMGARAETFSFVPSTAFPWIAALALGPTVGGYGFFNWALSKLSGRIVSLIVIAEAPIAALLGVFFLNEILEGLQVLGIALILIAIVLPGLATQRMENR